MSLQRALLLSIALHAIVLGIARPQQPSTQRAKERPLIARLAEARVEPVSVHATPAATPPRVFRGPARPKRPSLPSEAAVEAATSPPEIARQSTTEPAIAGPAAVPEQAVIVEQTGLPTLDPGTVAKYRLEIISAAKQFRRYPPIARENGWQGKAEVRVSFDGARQPALAINRSSGHAVLDRQAVETMSRALAPLPPPLLGRSFELDFPVIFSLED